MPAAEARYHHDEGARGSQGRIAFVGWLVSWVYWTAFICVGLSPFVCQLHGARYFKHLLRCGSTYAQI